jgi:hypothetical protein
VSSAARGDAQVMFEPGIGPGVRSDRFGTWSLITFLLLFVPLGGLMLPGALEELIWLPMIACVATTLGALVWGFAGILSAVGEQRQGAWHGLLKAAVPTVFGASFILLLVALSSMNFE